MCSSRSDLSIKSALSLITRVYFSCQTQQTYISVSWWSFHPTKTSGDWKSSSYFRLDGLTNNNMILSCLVFFLLHCWKSGDQGATPLLPPSSSVSCKCCALRQYNTIKWYKFLLAPSYDNCHEGAMWYALINSSLLSLLLNPAADKDLSRTVCGTEFHAAGMETAKFCSPHRTSAQHYQVTMSLCQYKQHKYGEINGSFAWKVTVSFNVPRDTLQVISQPITWVAHKPGLNQIKLQVTTQKPKQHSQRLYVYKQN